MTLWKRLASWWWSPWLFGSLTVSSLLLTIFLRSQGFHIGASVGNGIVGWTLAIVCAVSLVLCLNLVIDARMLRTPRRCPHCGRPME